MKGVANMPSESMIVDIYKKVLATKNTSLEYKQLRRKCIEQRDEFEKSLTEEQIKQLNNIFEERNIMDEVELREYFIEGFKQGVKILSEMLCNKK